MHARQKLLLLMKSARLSSVFFVSDDGRAFKLAFASVTKSLEASYVCLAALVEDLSLIHI